MTVRFLQAAESDLDQAVAFYEKQRHGLGAEFLLEVVAAVERISEYPRAWQALDKDIRRARVSRFPYALIYSLQDGDIVVIAVAHLHRRPDHWRGRSTQ